MTKKRTTPPVPPPVVEQKQIADGEVTERPKRSYTVVGLKEAEHMPMVLGGVEYDLARLTPTQIATLKANGRGKRYLVWNDQANSD